MIVHFYINKKFNWETNRHGVRLACTREFVAYEQDSWHRGVNAVSVPNRVTCPKCLEILIVKARGQLESLEARLLATAPQETKGG